MNFTELTSIHNPVLKKIRKISAGSLKLSGQFLAAEGVRILEEATMAGCRIDAAVLSESFGGNEREWNLIQSWIDRGVRIYRVKESLFRTISGVQTPQGAIALVHFPRRKLDEIIPASCALILCAFGLQDPGNLGTLIRSAAAAGATMVCAMKGTVSAGNPKTVRSSAGMIFRIPVIEQLEAEVFIDYCSRHHIQIYRTDVREGQDYACADLRSSSALVLGNEGRGATADEFRSLPSLHIPMAGNIESLNVAAAGSILLFEAWRQRRMSNGCS